MSIEHLKKTFVKAIHVHELSATNKSVPIRFFERFQQWRYQFTSDL